MQKSFQHFTEQLQTIRSGFISVGLIDTIKVPYHGQKVPISQISNSYYKNNQICITPFDVLLISTIVDVLKQSGFNAYVYSKASLVVSCPNPNLDQKDKVITQIKRLAEDARIAIRNIRKKGRQQFPDMEKPLQVLTEQFITKVDNLADNKIERI